MLQAAYEDGVEMGYKKGIDKFLKHGSKIIRALDEGSPKGQIADEYGIDVNAIENLREVINELELVSQQYIANSELCS